MNNAPCGTCAYTCGSAANREPHNNLKAQICVLGGIPFYCHKGSDKWKDPKNHGIISKVRFKELNLPICQGWVRRVRALAKVGYYKKNPTTRKIIAQIAAESLEIFVSSKDRKEKRQALRTLGKMLNKLNDLSKSFLPREQGE